MNSFEQQFARLSPQAQRRFLHRWGKAPWNDPHQNRPDLHRAWYPTENGETQRQREARITAAWIRDHLPTDTHAVWEYLLCRSSRLRSEHLLRHIAQNDAAELVELLYPRFPQLFHTTHRYTILPTFFARDSLAPYPPEILQRCALSRVIRFNAACFFAFCGATACLETLLELGADPNGLDSPSSWSYIELYNNRILPVTPLIAPFSPITGTAKWCWTSTAPRICRLSFLLYQI